MSGVDKPFSARQPTFIDDGTPADHTLNTVQGVEFVHSNGTQTLGSPFLSMAMSHPSAALTFQYYETRGYFALLTDNQTDLRKAVSTSADTYGNAVDFSDVVVAPSSTLSADGRFRCEMPVEYVYVTQSEIDFFKSRGVDYLITQTQMSTLKVAAGEVLARIRLGFTNPCKELWIAVQTNSNVTQQNDIFNYTNHRYPHNPKHQQLMSMNLDFNHETRISSDVADTNLLRYMQPMRHHTRVPTRDIYCYSFALDPESDTPSGQVNLSRVLNKDMTLNLTEIDEERTVRLYARVYNILRIQHGLGGVIFNDVSPN